MTLFKITRHVNSVFSKKHSIAELEKRRILADLMGRKGDTTLAQEGLYKITYKEGGEE